MSLFGSSPPGESTPQTSRAQNDKKSSLFDDDASESKPSSGLFNDSAADGESPWSMPTPKRQSKTDPVKTLLPGSDVPDSYVDAFDTVSSSEYGVAGGRITPNGVKAVLEGVKIAQSQLETITGLVNREGANIGRNEFNVLLALIGLAQEGDEVSLDTVDERRKSLPIPNIPYIKRAKSAKVSENLDSNLSQDAKAGAREPDSPYSGRDQSRRLRKDSLENIDSDPWASPATTKPQTSTVRNDVTPSADAVTAAKPIRTGLGENARTTSAFTTHANTDGGNGSLGGLDDGMEPDRGAIGGWDASITNRGIEGGGFGSTGDDPGQSSGATSRALGGGRTTTLGTQETVTVALLPEKEGMFMFQHHNYEVKSRRRGSAVVRRYSDFVWLLDCLHRRYPFRQLPLLPPKRVAVNGRHLSADVSFIEKRRRGLIRFLNALVRHPVLCQEQLVVMFLTVPTELAVWRKQATISVQEEFAGKPLPPDLEDSLPQNLADTFDTVRSGVKQAAENYIGLCNLLERLAKRNQGVAADHLRFSQALTNLTETSTSTYAIDTNDVPLLNEGIGSTAKHMNLCQSLLEDEARAWDEGALEDFKKQRDALVSVREMFERRDRYAKDNIPQLERRIETNENKLQNILNGAGGKPGEQEKLETAVRNDKQSIIDQHARGVFIRECIRDELVYFQQSQYHISRMHQDWSQERVKYAELQADNWRRLSEEVEHMPSGD